MNKKFNNKNIKKSDKTNFFNDNKENILLRCSHNNIDLEQVNQQKKHQQHKQVPQFKEEHDNMKVKKSKTSPAKVDFSKNNQTKKDTKELEKRVIMDLYNQTKLNPKNFHSSQTFEQFLTYTLNLKSDVTNEILTNQKVQYWIDRNRQSGFVYQTFPTSDVSGEPKEKRLLPVRCDLCKFYGHLSHTCSIKELAFKLNNVVLRNGACRCHICGMLGHPAEAGLCPYIACSFCLQNGHWNFMCPNKDKISRTLCHTCQRYGHISENCPDQWRQFDRISSYEQTPYKESSKKSIYCYQCAQKGHYGYNCPEFYRKYFIRDYHHLDNNPVYFFAAASPFVKHEITITDADKEIISQMVDMPIDVRYEEVSSQNDREDDDEDTLSKLEKFQYKNLKNSSSEINSIIFNETHSNIPLKEYIRKWSNWVMDFHWVFTLKFFIDSLPTYKLYNFIKYYPTLDNFILHWMWWSYTLSKDLERFTNDPFCAAGTTPWLGKNMSLKTNCTNENFLKQEFSTASTLPPSRYFQYSDSAIKLINSLLFSSECNNTQTSASTNGSATETKASSLAARTKSFNVNPLSVKQPHKTQTVTNFITATPIIANQNTIKLQSNKPKRLTRSKSCNVLLDTAYVEIHKPLLNTKRKTCKSTTSSPYINGKDKYSRLAARSSDRDCKSLKLNYVNDLYQLKSKEFTNALLERLDSYCNLDKQTNEISTSLENLVELVQADEKIAAGKYSDELEELDALNANNEEDQDKTIVFDLGDFGSIGNNENENAEKENEDDKNDDGDNVKNETTEQIEKKNESIRKIEIEIETQTNRIEDNNIEISALKINSNVFEKLFINTNNEFQTTSQTSVDNNFSSTTNLLKFLLKINQTTTTTTTTSTTNVDDKENLKHLDAKSTPAAVNLDKNENLILLKPIEPISTHEDKTDVTQKLDERFLRKKSSSINDLKRPQQQQQPFANRTNSFRSSYHSHHHNNSYNYSHHNNHHQSKDSNKSQYSVSIQQQQQHNHHHHHQQHIHQQSSSYPTRSYSFNNFNNRKSNENSIIQQQQQQTKQTTSYQPITLSKLNQFNSMQQKQQHQQTQKVSTSRISPSSYTTSQSSSSASSSLKYSPNENIPIEQTNNNKPYSYASSLASTTTTTTTMNFNGMNKNTNKQVSNTNHKLKVNSNFTNTNTNTNSTNNNVNGKNYFNRNSNRSSYNNKYHN